MNDTANNWTLKNFDLEKSPTIDIPSSKILDKNTNKTFEQNILINELTWIKIDLFNIYI